MQDIVEAIVYNPKTDTFLHLDKITDYRKRLQKLVVSDKTRFTNNTKKLLNCGLFENFFQYKLVSYRKYSNDLLCKLIDWSLYDTRVC